MGDSHGEATPLINREQGWDTHTKAAEELAQARLAASAAADKLKTGLNGWIRANKERKHSLEVTIDRCNDITHHTSEQFAKLTEANNAQQAHLELISQTAKSVEHQSLILDDLGAAIDDIKARTSEMEGTSLWAPPRFVKWCCLYFLIIVLLFMGVAFLLRDGLGIKHLTKRAK
eukprot:TRINITY_DN6007_c0_g1_i1.p1 TRINITY_DN6007_c0_g1~~TRINITY_DN6007_c0_g1_i1.p1  ORF type:complete len:174 (+),score=20.43 TRINITY_DN6007_c0_g1_i1:263-784(+)